jgi:hypothetical protein
LDLYWNQWAVSNNQSVCTAYFLDFLNQISVLSLLIKLLNCKIATLPTESAQSFHEFGIEPIANGLDEKFRQLALSLGS